jgi:signal recognition particle GTPase
MGEKYKKILNALTVEERTNPELIQSRTKQRVSTETGESVQEINLLLNLYTNSQALHSWVRRRVRDKKELPKTKSECQVLMMGDPTGISVGSMQKKMQKRSGRRGSRLPF